MKKALSLILAVLTVFGAVSAGLAGIHTHAAENLFREGSYVYAVNNGKAEIKDYLDTFSTDAIVIPETLGGYTVSKICSQAFCGSKCVSITIPSGVERIDYDAFAFDMPNIESFYVAEGNSKYVSTDGVLFQDVFGIANFLLAYPKNKAGEFYDLKGTFGVAAYAFCEARHIREMKFTSSIYLIDRYAFYGAENLEYIRFGTVNLFSIGDYAFADCVKLTDVEHFSTDHLGSNVFDGTPFLNDESKYDKDGVFYHNRVLVKALPEYDREYYEIREGTVLVAGGAFDWDSLREVVIPESLSRIYDNPFRDCENLRTITSKNPNLSVDEYGVLYCGEDICCYPNGRYKTCYVVPWGVDEIQPHAFDGSPIEKIYLPASLHNIYDSALGDVKDIHFGGDEADWSDVISFEEDYDSTVSENIADKVYFSSYSDGEHVVVLKSDKKSVCSCGYESYTPVLNGEYAENGFTYTVADNEAEIVLCPSNISGELMVPETLGDYPVTSIGKNAFNACKSTSVFIPNTVVNIDKASGLGDLRQLTSISVAAGNRVYSGEDGILYNREKSTLLLYPDAKAGTEYFLPSGVKTVASEAFADNRYIQTLVIDGALETIEADAFRKSAALTTLTVISGLENIGERAFADCKKLATINLSKGIESIGIDAFKGSAFIEDESNCDTDGVFYHNGYLLATFEEEGVKEYTVKPDTTLIAGGAFRWYDLEKINITASVAYVCDAAFNACESLSQINVSTENEYLYTDATGALYSKDGKALLAYPQANRLACFAVPEGVEEIQAYALDFDNILSNKYIPVSVTKIGTEALGSNPATTINYQGTKAQWESVDFSGGEAFIGGLKTNYGVYNADGHNVVAHNITDPTCSKAGSNVYVCACGYRNVVEIPRLAHTPTGDWITVSTLTCTTDEVKVKYCKVCGEVALRQIIEATGYHNYETVSKTEATCTTDGITEYRCRKCSHTYSEITKKATGHLATDEVISIAPTCTTDGGEFYKCAYCGDKSDEVISIAPATGHTEGVWAIEKEPTCTQTGFKTLSCTSCGKELDAETIPQKHDYVETEIQKTCTLIETQYSCKLCKDEYVTLRYISGTHNPETVYREPTCTTPGRMFSKCTVCDAILRDTVVETSPALGHSYTEKVTKEPTCTEKGAKVLTCHCGEQISEAIREKGHVFGEWVFSGSNIFSGKCSVCGELFEDVRVSVTLNNETLKVPNGFTGKLTASVTENITSDIIFTSSNDKVVTVDSEGNIAAKSSGTAVITARINGTQIKDTCTVTVVANVYPVNWMVDSDVHTVSSVTEGAKIKTPAPPEKEGYEFLGWTPSIPDKMPSHSLTFYAVFNKISKSDKYDVSAHYSPDCFNEDISLDVAEITSDREPGGVYMVEGEYYKQVGLYNIKAVNGKSEIVQPNEGHKVTIRIAIPDGYKSRTDFVIYHRFAGGGREQLSTEKGTVKVENGYLVFEVSSFSEFEVLAVSANIKITKKPTKTVYNFKEEIDLTGIEMTFVSADGTENKITNVKYLSVTGFNSSKIGKQTVTVHYGQYSDTFEVEVRYSFVQLIIRIFFFGFLWWK